MTERVKTMTILNNIELVLGLVSILLAIYSLLGFIRLTRFWFQIPNLERNQELFAYISVFLGAFIGSLILMILESV